jgi:CRISPR/Cas system endoribonuclease Cas6 (RAMP superfamily)
MKDEKIISISEVKKGNDSKYFCISCGNELIPKMGVIREHHFAHKNKQENKILCSEETYLHRLGKNISNNFQQISGTITHNMEFDMEAAAALPVKIVEKKRKTKPPAEGILSRCSLKHVDVTAE